MWELLLAWIRTGRLGPLTFGQSPDDVVALLGEPSSIIRPDIGGDLEGRDYDDLHLIFDEDRLFGMVIHVERRPLQLPPAFGDARSERLGARSLARVRADLERVGITLTVQLTCVNLMVFQTPSGVKLTFTNGYWRSISQTEWPPPMPPNEED